MACQLKLGLHIQKNWGITLEYDSENTVIEIVSEDSTTSIALSDLELTLFIKQLGLIIDAKRKEHGDKN